MSTLAERLFRLSLLAYPRRFRERFGDAMLETFRDRVAERSRGGRGALLLLVLRAWADAALSGLRERVSPSQAPAPGGPARGRGARSSPADALAQDVRFAVRSLVRRPGFSAVVVLTLALGVGANTAIFSVVNGVLLRPLPYDEPDRLVTVWAGDRGEPDPRGAMSRPDIGDLAEASTLATLVGVSGGNVALTGLGEAEVVTGARVSEGLLGTFGLAPLLGRDLTREDAVPGSAPVVVLSHGFWTQRLGGDPDVLGSAVELQGATHQVVGVAPPGFDYPDRSELWRPYPDDPGCGRGCHLFRAVGRLAEGATLDAARSEADALAIRLSEEYPDSNHDKAFHLLTLEDTLVGDVRRGLWVMLGAVGLVLLIACANVASLLLARGQSRAGEVAVRSAPGAGRARLVGLVLVESVVLSAVGGAVGLFLAGGAVDLLRRVSPGTVPRIDQVAIDPAVLLFTLGLVAVVALLFGLSPALHLTRSGPATRLAAAGRGGGETRSVVRSRGALLAVEVAVCLVLLVGAGLLLKSFARIHGVDPGFETRDVLRFTLSLPESRYGELDAVTAFYRELEQRVLAVPGVEAVGSVFGAPMGSGNAIGGVIVEGRPAPRPEEETYAGLRSATAGYLGAMRIPVLRGREILPSDDASSQPVAVVNETFVRQNFPGEDPLGRRFEVTIDFGFGSPLWTVVGVVPDVRARGPMADPVPEVYVPQAQMGPAFMTTSVRTASGAPAVLPAVREVVRALDADVPLRGVETVAEALARQAAPTRFYLILVGLFAVLAVVLASVGLYGVAAYLVSRRTREIGLRMALGARRGEIARLIVGQGMRPVVVGALLGLGGAWVGARALGSLLFRVEPDDPVIFAGVTVVLLVVAAASLLLPARQAVRIDPAVALRRD